MEPFSLNFSIRPRFFQAEVINHNRSKERYPTYQLMKVNVTRKWVYVDSTPLRWFKKNLERILIVGTLTEAYAQTASDPEASCLGYLKDYENPSQEVSNAWIKASKQAKGKTHEIGMRQSVWFNCLSRIFDPKICAKPRCPLCRHRIDPILNDIPQTCKASWRWDIVGVLCCTISVYVFFNPFEAQNNRSIKRLGAWSHFGKNKTRRN